MAKYTKKWDKDFTKKYSNCMVQLESMEREFKSMVEDNPDEYISIYPDTSNIELGEENGFYIYDCGNDESPHVDIQLSSQIGSFNFTFSDLKKLIDLRDQLIKAIDSFKREPKVTKVTSSDDFDEEELEGLEPQEFEVKAERSLTEAWTYTVTARSASEAIKMVEEDADQDFVTHNDDSEYYDYGDIEYEVI